MQIYTHFSFCGSFFLVSSIYFVCAYVCACMRVSVCAPVPSCSTYICKGGLLDHGWRMIRGLEDDMQACTLFITTSARTHTHTRTKPLHTHTQNPSTSPTKPLDSPGLVEKGEHQGGVELWTEPRVSPPQVVCFYRVRPDWGQCVFLSKGKAGKPVALKKRGLMGNQYKMRQGSRRAFHCTPIHYVHFSMVDDKRI